MSETERFRQALIDIQQSEGDREHLRDIAAAAHPSQPAQPTPECNGKCVFVSGKVGLKTPAWLNRISPPTKTYIDPYCPKHGTPVTERAGLYGVPDSIVGTITPADGGETVHIVPNTTSSKMLFCICDDGLHDSRRWRSSDRLNAQLQQLRTEREAAKAETSAVDAAAHMLNEALEEAEAALAEAETLRAKAGLADEVKDAIDAFISAGNVDEVDLPDWLVPHWHALNDLSDRISALDDLMATGFDWKEACKFLIAFVPPWAKDVPEGYGEMFYGTLTYEGDLAVKQRVDEIMAHLTSTQADTGG